MEELFLLTQNYAIKNSGKDDIHGFPHVERVHNLCEKIGSELNANLKILRIAALLHDVGRKIENYPDDGINHAELSVLVANDFLESHKDYFNQDEIGEINHCIRAHSFSNDIEPKTLEAKILSDVDKLDALGAVGLYRTIGFTVKTNGGIEQVIKHLEEKILKLKNRLYLDSSIEIANKRESIIKAFYKELKEEK